VTSIVCPSVTKTAYRPPRPGAVYPPCRPARPVPVAMVSSVPVTWYPVVSVIRWRSRTAAAERSPSKVWTVIR
jgi:hypothetical protein